MSFNSYSNTKTSYISRKISIGVWISFLRLKCEHQVLESEIFVLVKENLVFLMLERGMTLNNDMVSLLFDKVIQIVFSKIRIFR